MDCFNSSKGQVVVEVKEGSGFTFLTNPVKIIASLNGIKLESKEILPANNPLFDSVLVWQADTKYLRRLRTSNTALKLECFTYLNYNKQHSKKDRIGYVLLNLKEAQIITDNQDNKVIPTWHRLLGLKNLPLAHKPEVLLKFKIEEVPKMKAVLTNTVPNEVQHDSIEIKSRVMNFGMGDNNAVGLSPNQVQEPIQIGPPHLCTELYELTINVLSVDHISEIIAKEKVDLPITAHFVMFGYSIFTKDLSVFREHMNNGRISLKIWSQHQFICAYFKEFSTLVLSIYCDEEIVGTAQMDLKVLGSITAKRNVSVVDKLQIRSSLTKEADESNPEANKSFLEMEIQLLYIKDYISTKIDQETQSLSEYNSEKYAAGISYKPVSPSRCPESSPYSNSFDPKAVSPIVPKSDNQPIIKSHDEVAFTPRLNLALETPECIENSPTSPNIPDVEQRSTDNKENSKKIFKVAALKACEELEDWKEKQQEMFKFELKKKTDRHLKKLSNEWLKKKYELEGTLKKRIDECQILKGKLVTALEDLSHRSEQLSIKEEELRIANEDLDKKYNQKFHELRKASKLYEYDVEDKIHEITSEKTELYKKLEDSRKEILRLQDALLNQETMPHHLSNEQSANFISEIKSLEQKLEKAVESKTFFKEQWGKAVRELHRMKEEEQQQLKWQIQKNRQELQTLGLVKEISEEVGEMKKDRSSIKNIRNELTNFISSNNDSLVDFFHNNY